MNIARVASAPVSVVDSAEKLPSYISNVSADGGDVALRESDRAIVALLDIGERRLIALWAGDQSQAPTLRAAMQMAKFKGYEVIESRPATRDVVALCYESREAQIAEDELEDTEATRLFDEILAAAVAQGASDLHIVPMRRHAVVRARINGELYDQRMMTLRAADTMARAMYSQADVDSRRNQAGFNPDAYQDASITRRVVVNGRAEELKLRWASGPVWPDSFDVVMRILNVGQASSFRDLEALGYAPAQRELLLDALRQPSGVILLCGTTGAGKSTTIASLAEQWCVRHEGRRSLRTIEQPPEYVISGGRQMPVSRSADASQPDSGFHRALQSAMRMDPDALYLGEIRDEVTADLMEQMVLTGHKVFTTVHAGSVMAGVWRLEGLGLSRERLASAGFINAVVHQALVPILCDGCSTPYSVAAVGAERHAELLTDVGADVLATARLRGAGCEKCKNGLIGRRAVASMLIPDLEFCAHLRRGDDVGAARYWRSGKQVRHGAAQALSEVQQAVELIAAGQLCPNDAERHLGRLVQDDAQ